MSEYFSPGLCRHCKTITNGKECTHGDCCDECLITEHKDYSNELISIKNKLYQSFMNCIDHFDISTNGSEAEIYIRINLKGVFWCRSCRNLYNIEDMNNTDLCSNCRLNDKNVRQ